MVDAANVAVGADLQQNVNGCRWTSSFLELFQQQNMDTSLFLRKLLTIFLAVQHFLHNTDFYILLITNLLFGDSQQEEFPTIRGILYFQEGILLKM